MLVFALVVTWVRYGLASDLLASNYSKVSRSGTAYSSASVKIGHNLWVLKPLAESSSCMICSVLLCTALTVDSHSHYLELSDVIAIFRKVATLVNFNGSRLWSVWLCILRAGEPYNTNISVMIGVEPEPEASNNSFVVYATSVTEDAGRSGHHSPLCWKAGKKTCPIWTALRLNQRFTVRTWAMTMDGHLQELSETEFFGKALDDRQTIQLAE